MDFFHCPTRADYLIPLIILCCNLLTHPLTIGFLFCGSGSGSRDPPPRVITVFYLSLLLKQKTAMALVPLLMSPGLYCFHSKLERKRSQQRFPPESHRHCRSTSAERSVIVWWGLEYHRRLQASVDGSSRGSAPWWALSWRSLVCVWLITWNSFDVCIQRVRYPLL